MKHEIELKVKSSSPDIPLATFRPTDQFANIDGSARFYCEAFIGKKDLPDISITVRWYQVTDDNKIHSIADEAQEVVKREDEQIIGSYLKISGVTYNHFGRYLCRVEMGNSKTHRLEMSASLINALPIEADTKSMILTNPFFLGSCAAIITIITFFLILRFTQSWWIKYLGNFASEQKIIKLKNREKLNLSLFQSHTMKNNSTAQQRVSNDTDIEIDVT
jgi:hypothetical protein